MAWMAWTLPTGLFFGGIAILLVVMGLLQAWRPSPPPRVGLLGLPMQRGDRLFLSLIGAAFIHLAWLGLAPEAAPLWIASIVSLVYAALVFRFV
ncbi:MAG: DUF2160 domain-containing protein [Hyphomonadaceae bacterium]